MSRTRTRNVQHSTGTYVMGILGNPVDSWHDNTLVYDERCVDVADSPGVDHPFNLSRFEIDSLEPLNGTLGTGFWAGSQYIDYYPPGFNNSYASQHLTVNNDINAGDFVTLLARTNPSRPVITPLTLIQDVVDIPRQLKGVGRLLKGGSESLNAKELANQNLGIQFGWLPLIQDVKDLLNLQSHIDRRSNELNRLYSATGIKRRIGLGSSNASDTQKNIYLSSEGSGWVVADLHRYTGSTKWGTVRWLPTSRPPYHPKTAELNRQARKIVSGFTSEGLTKGVWDLVPWTWLIDWFAPVGDYLLQHSNTVPAHAVHVNVMRKTITSTQFRRIQPYINDASWATGGNGVTTYTTLERSQSSSSPPTSLPFIGLKRLSILTSLFIQRFK
ncbi:MAG: putative maturation protein [Alehxovirus nemoriscola]|uniref:Maturation protein n=1 Tax=Leviviridae sp. TaxID=2027243 RepID=A0ABY3SU28_9VIRU|nr:MAG: putative maturation protein [Leviviridae sp.]